MAALATCASWVALGLHAAARKPCLHFKTTLAGQPRPDMDGKVSLVAPRASRTTFSRSRPESCPLSRAGMISCNAANFQPPHSCILAATDEHVQNLADGVISPLVSER